MRNIKKHDSHFDNIREELGGFSGFDADADKPVISAKDAYNKSKETETSLLDTLNVKIKRKTELANSVIPLLGLYVQRLNALQAYYNSTVNTNKYQLWNSDYTFRGQASADPKTRASAVGELVTARATQTGRLSEAQSEYNVLAGGSDVNGSVANIDKRLKDQNATSKKLYTDYVSAKAEALSTYEKSKIASETAEQRIAREKQSTSSSIQIADAISSRNNKKFLIYAGVGVGVAAIGIGALYLLKRN